MASPMWKREMVVSSAERFMSATDGTSAML
jgi:hypothetical protein